MPGLEKKNQEETLIEISDLKDKARKQLELIKKQNERLKVFEPDTDLLMQWYDLKSSQFSKLAYYYKEKSWFQKQILHAEVLAGAVVLGFVVNALLFVSLIAAYYQIVSLLSEHYEVEEANKTAMKESLAKLSEGLKQSIESFNSMETKLDAAFTAMEERNEDVAESIQLLNQEAIKLHGQILLLDETVKQLQEQQKGVSSTTHTIHRSSENLGKEMDGLVTTIKEKRAALDLMSETIGTIISGAMGVQRDINHVGCEIQKEAIVLKEQEKQCKGIETKADFFILKSEQAIAVLDASFERCQKEESDDDEIFLLAQRALGKRTERYFDIPQPDTLPAACARN